MNSFLADLRCALRVLGVSAASVVIYLEVGFLMLTIALLACLLPAWRAMRVNSMISLRYE